MSSLLHAALAAALRLVRLAPPAHAFVHGVAVQLIRTRWGERFVRHVLGADALSDAEYRAWLERYDTLTDADRAAIAAHVARMAHRPRISVVMAAYRSDERVLRQAVASVQAQLYPHWELCIADDGTPGDQVWRVLGEFAAADPRIRIVRRAENGGIAAATNTALDLVTGDYIAFLDHDDLMAERALYEVAAELEAHPDADLVFTDEDKIDERGRRSQPHFKTDWNARLMLTCNAVNHLAVFRTRLVRELGGLREGFDGAQDYDLVLRASERTTPERIRHIPWVLYHWRWQGRQGSYSRERMAACAAAAQRAVESHLARVGEPDARVVQRAGAAAWLRVRRPVPSPAPLVSVIVPTRDRADLLARCADGVLRQTAYAPIELVVVDNGSVEPATHALFARLRADPRVRILPAPGPFNYAALMNRAVAEAAGAIVVLLNNDISVIEPDWLGEMVAEASRPAVGAVGAYLLYPDDSVQHAGVVLGAGDQQVAGHLYSRSPESRSGYQGLLAMPRNVSAVTGACLAMRKGVFEAVGGMDAERLAVAFNDVDLCLRVREAGFQIVWTPFARLHHHESATRGADLAPEAARRLEREIAAMRERWGAALDSDPFYSPVFDKRRVDYSLAQPPARRAPWLEGGRAA